MNNIDKRILRLIDVLIFQNQIKNDTDFCKSISILPQNLSKTRKGLTHFTVTHIEAICKKYNVNANWIFGQTHKVFNTPNSIEIKEI